MEAEETKRRIPSWKEPPDVCDWLETHFYIEDPTDPETGLQMPPCPIQLFPHQKRILRALVEKDAEGKFIWPTIVYSAPKKVARPALRRVL